MAKKNTYTCLQSIKIDGRLRPPGSELQLTESEFEAIAKRNSDALAVGGISEEAVGAPGPSLDELSVPELEKRAAELGIELASIEGTGSGGNVVKRDLVAAIEATAE